MFGFFDIPIRKDNQEVSDFDANNSFMPNMPMGGRRSEHAFRPVGLAATPYIQEKGLQMQPLYSLRRDISIAGTKSRYD